jgi:SAM-dependent methyltransferase
MIRRLLRGGWGRVKRWVEGDRPVPVPTVLARNYLAGDGIEVGALHNPLPVPRTCRVRYADRMTVAELRKQYPNLDGLPLVPVDVVDDGERLATVPDGSQDFVIANHFLEHCQDPIGALTNFFRVLRPGGVLYMAVPDKRFTFDAKRPVTTLDHLRRDHAEGPDWSRAGHYDEYARLAHGCGTDEEARGVAADMLARGYSIHFHVWTQKELLELFLSLKDDLGFDFEVVCKNGMEVIFVLRKGPA